MGDFLSHSMSSPHPGHCSNLAGAIEPPSLRGGPDECWGGERQLLSEEMFFKHVDQVLTANRRAPLGPGGPQHRSIRVNPGERVLQILAGPGSGKTEMLVWRVLFELLVRGVQSERLLVTTFTNKAATELGIRLVERCDQILGSVRSSHGSVDDPHVHDVRIGTIHSLCDALLAEFDTNYMEAGTEVIDEIETRVRIARDRYFAFREDPRNPNAVDIRLLRNEPLVSLFRPPWLDPRRPWPSTTMQQVDALMALLAQQTETWMPRCLQAGIPNGCQMVHGLSNLTADLEKLRHRWEVYLDKNQVLDFVTIQKRFLDRQHLILSHIDHVFVDEFQDTNPIQFGIHANWLKGSQTRLTVVGDDDQSLYRFRGSDISCFNQLEPHCKSSGIAYRQEKLEENWRSTRRIVDFARAFREASALKASSMQKRIIAPSGAELGLPPRLLVGPWEKIGACVADELARIGAGRLPTAEVPVPPSAAVLMFSTSERPVQSEDSAALTLRLKLQANLLRAYNPRNKTAAEYESPIAELFGLLSYLIDPVIKAPVGKGGRMVEVYASVDEQSKKDAAPTVPPSFRISDAHASFQKAFIKADGGNIGSPVGNRRELVEYIDQIRSDLISTTSNGDRTRLSIAGLVARLLTFDRYRGKGYTVELFRQGLFTTLLEATIAPSRMSMKSLDAAMEPTRDPKNRKIIWPDQFWQFLNLMGTLLDHTSLDDVEVEAFAEHAVAIMTFHQAKGLEFDHVYVAATGREVNPHAVLQTMLFSGKRPHYDIVDRQPVTRDKDVLALAAADRDREVYVALTRAKKRLTFLWDPKDERPNLELHQVLKTSFAQCPRKQHPEFPDITVQEWNYA